MDRKIKFRAWNKAISEMIDWKTIKIDFESWLEDDYCHLMQYTGLTDKNGKEIYSGDILGKRDERIIGIVNFYRGGFIIQDIKSIPGDKNFTYYLLYNWAEDAKIIGNIYENKELNEKTKG